MTQLRTVLFWLHLVCGVAAGLVIFVMSGTGVLLALKPQIQDWIERDVRYVTPQSAPRLGAGQLLAAVTAADPEAVPQTLALARAGDSAASVTLAGRGTVYVDPYTGAVLGTGSARTAKVFEVLTNWHRYLGGTGESRAAGRSITGISNVAFLVLACSGLFIWWPKRLTRQSLRHITWFRRTATARARDFNWHNTIGFWCLIPIVIMTVSGTVLSYTWANDLVYRLAGSPVPPRGGQAALALQGSGGSAPQGSGASSHRAGEDATPARLDWIWARAQQQIPAWSLLSMRLPNRSGGPLTFTITDGANWNRFARSTLTLDSASGEVLLWQPYERSSLGQQMRGWLRFAHTGELGGVAGQVIAGIGCLGGVFLVCTGLSLAFRRLWNWSLWTACHGAIILTIMNK